MKRCIITILLYLLFKPAFAQVEARCLYVYCISEYIDGYVIKAIDNSKGDTLSIVTLKNSSPHTSGYEKVMVGKSYQFEYQDRKKIAAVEPCTMVIRIKTTVIWNCKDGIESMPVFATNTKGLWLK